MANNGAGVLLPAAGSGATGARGLAVLSSRVLTGRTRPGGAVQRLSLAATGTAVVLSATGAASRATLSATGSVAAVGFVTTGAPVMARRTATGAAGQSGAVSFRARVAAGEARGAVYGAAVRLPLQIRSVTGFVILEHRTATGVARSAVPATYLTAAMNARNAYITEYDGYEFNGYARIGNEYYATGADGLYLLDGTTDDGTDIEWSVLTGQMDGKDPGLKRLPEVLLSLRNTGPVKVTVHPDDNLSYDYMLPAVKLDTLHQHRVVPGKGMRSRYYAVGLSGVNNSKVEVDSMQVNMTQTTRRLG